MTALALIVATLFAGDPPAPKSRAILWGLDSLQAIAKQDPSSLRIVDVRKKADYDAGHLPGAVWVDAKSIETLAGELGGLQNKEAWEILLKPIGWQPDRLIVVYGDNNQLDAARLWWLLTYLGAERVALMDGNFSLWQKEHRPVTAEVPNVEPKAFPVRFQADRLATRDDVSNLLKTPGETKVLDARTEGEHLGTKKLSKKAGRIPAACRLEWVELVDKDGRFLKADDLRAKLDKAGVKAGAPVVTHCQGGGRASVDAFAAESVGHPTRNYYLGWSDWGNADETPAEVGPVK